MAKMRLTIGTACDGHRVQLDDLTGETLFGTFINQEDPERWPEVLRSVLMRAGCDHIVVEAEEDY